MICFLALVKMDKASILSEMDHRLSCLLHLDFHSDLSMVDFEGKQNNLESRRYAFWPW